MQKVLVSNFPIMVDLANSQFYSGYNSVMANKDSYLTYSEELLNKIIADCERHYICNNDYWQLGAARAVKEILNEISDPALRWAREFRAKIGFNEKHEKRLRGLLI